MAFQSCIDIPKVRRPLSKAPLINVQDAVYARCDEAKPACNACLRKGIPCGGYQRQLRWSSKHEKALPTPPEDQCEDQTPTSEATQEPPTVEDEFVWQHTISATSDTSSDIGSSMMSFPAEQAAGVLSDMDSSSFSALDALDTILLPDTQSLDLEFPSCLGLQVESPPAGGLLEEFMAMGSGGGDKQLMHTGQRYYNRLNTTISPMDPSMGLSFLIPPAINDMPTLLINNWFDNVCSVWSAYDSHINLNRQLAGALWFKSDAVSSSLQFMSVALMADQLPQIKPEVTRYVQTAMKAIEKELQAVKSISHFDSVPASVLLALCCIGTTLCWIDARQLGLPFLRETKTLLGRVKQQAHNFSQEDCTLLAFFTRSFIYWDMLSAVVSYNNDLGPELEAETSEAPKTITDEDEAQNGTILPHPWTGISTVPPRLFTSAIKLCRSFRVNIRSGMTTARNLNSALAAIEKAKHIEEQLLSMELPLMTQLSETGDELTPRRHLLETAEAYRLASLLQIYQTFPDLVAMRLPPDSVAQRNEDGHVPWDGWIVPLSLRLIKLLKDIPPTSGSRVIQPLLYISAGTGLKFEPSANSGQRGSETDKTVLGASNESRSLSGYMDQYLGLEVQYGPEETISPLALSIGSARRFVMNRLNILESNLPPKPIGMAKKLVQAIWAAYDQETPGSSQVHWIDVMEEQELRTLLG
ncbi:hypothetical protein GQ53DRAFT_848664 [Thozetella sp. PMI_491]|nr:hypothetical protein GQ53DRAFT_848664 [Thozetella sp. PMI_491]